MHYLIVLFFSLALALWVLISLLNALKYMFFTVIAAALGSAAVAGVVVAIFTLYQRISLTTADFRATIDGVTITVCQSSSSRSSFSAGRVAMCWLTAASAIVSGIVWGPIADRANVIGQPRIDGLEWTAVASGFWIGSIIGLLASLGGVVWVTNKFVSRIERRSHNLIQTRLENESLVLRHLQELERSISEVLSEAGVRWSYGIESKLSWCGYKKLGDLRSAVGSALALARRDLELYQSQSKCFLVAFAEARHAHKSADRTLDMNPSASLRERLDSATIGLKPFFLQSLVDEAGFEEAANVLLELKAECELISSQAGLGARAGGTGTNPPTSQRMPTTKTEALDLLGLPESATIEQIRTVYRAHMNSFHPDRAGDDEIEHVKRINVAWNILREP